MLVPVMKTEVGTVYQQTQLKELLAEVDAFPGEPTEEDMRRLAQKYGDTEPFIRSCFETRIYRDPTKKPVFPKKERKVTRPLGRRPNWQEWEIAFIKENWEKMTPAEIAAALNEDPRQQRQRTADAVRTKARTLGFKRPRNWHDWEINFIKANWLKMTPDEIAAALNEDPRQQRQRTADSVYTKAYRLGLRYPRDNERRRMG